MNVKKTELCRKGDGNTFPKNSKTPSQFNWNCFRIYGIYLEERERERENLKLITLKMRYRSQSDTQKKRSKMSSVTKV